MHTLAACIVRALSHEGSLPSLILNRQKAEGKEKECQMQT
jgi:hypothetical protein